MARERPSHSKATCPSKSRCAYRWSACTSPNPEACTVVAGDSSALWTLNSPADSLWTWVLGIWALLRHPNPHSLETGSRQGISKHLQNGIGTPGRASGWLGPSPATARGIDCSDLRTAVPRLAAPRVCHDPRQRLGHDRIDRAASTQNGPSRQPFASRAPPLRASLLRGPPSPNVGAENAPNRWTAGGAVSGHGRQEQGRTVAEPATGGGIGRRAAAARTGAGAGTVAALEVASSRRQGSTDGQTLPSDRHWRNGDGVAGGAAPGGGAHGHGLR